MKKIYNALLMLLVAFFFSCEKEKDPIDLPKTSTLKIELGDSIKLSKEDISLFDSSTCILFLKDK